jgi:uncharacterized protein
MVRRRAARRRRPAAHLLRRGLLTVATEIAPETAETQMPTDDGVALATAVRTPPGEGPWPASLFRTPYGAAFEMVEPNHGLAAPRLAVALQDVRGRGGSGGAFDLGASDGSDGAAAVEWLAAQPWCDGDVAMHGISYAGMTQLRAALQRPPSLRAISPARCPAWWRPLTLHEGGALRLSLAAHWLPRQAAEAPDTPDAARAGLYALALEFEQVVRQQADGSQWLDVEAARRHPALRLPLRDRPEYDAAPLFGAIWRSLFDSPYPHTWLSDPGPAVGDRIDVPVLVFGAWYDPWAQDQASMLAALQRHSPPDVASRHRLVMTPFSHAPMPAGETLHAPGAARFDDTLLARWTQEWLLGELGPARELAPATWYVVGADRWDEADTWPPPGVRATTLHLHAQGGLADGELVGADAAASLPDRSVAWMHDAGDPVPTRGGPALGLPAGPMQQGDLTAGARPDVCSFTSAPLREPLEICGPVVASISLRSDAPGADVCVKLLDVEPGGAARNIVDGYVRGRFRFGPGTPPPRPGAVETYPVHCWSIAYRVEAGHRLRVDVCSSSFPRHDVSASARQALHTGAAHPSSISVSVRGENAMRYSNNHLPIGKKRGGGRS